MKPLNGDGPCVRLDKAEGRRLSDAHSLLELIALRVKATGDATYADRLLEAAAECRGAVAVFCARHADELGCGDVPVAPGPTPTAPQPATADG